MTQWQLVFWGYDAGGERPFVSYYEDREEAEEDYMERLEWSYGDDLPPPKLTEVKVNQ